MTRQEIADYLDGFDVMPISQEQTVVNQRVIDAAAAELRKSCAGCVRYDEGWCEPLASRHDWRVVPSDGSGHCHEWSAK
jgi:hypothetical protein